MARLLLAGLVVVVYIVPASMTSARASTALAGISGSAQVGQALTILAALPHRAAPIAPMYVADFETGDFSQVVSQQESTPDRITVTTSNPLQGTYSALVKDGPSDSNVAGSQTSLRAEMDFGRISTGFFGEGSLEGKETWVTWEQKLGSSFEIGSWCVLTQFLGSSGSGWPMFAIQANGPAPGRLLAVVRGGPVSSNARSVRLQKPLQLGARLRFKVYHLWSTGGGGIVKVWLNGVLKATITGPNLFIGYESTPYHKAGIYRSSSGVTRESQLLIDNVRWWSSDPDPVVRVGQAAHAPASAPSRRSALPEAVVRRPAGQILARTQAGAPGPQKSSTDAAFGIDGRDAYRQMWK